MLLSTFQVKLQAVHEAKKQIIVCPPATSNHNPALLKNIVQCGTRERAKPEKERSPGTTLHGTALSRLTWERNFCSS